MIELMKIFTANRFAVDLQDNNRAKFLIILNKKNTCNESLEKLVVEAADDHLSLILNQWHGKVREFLAKSSHTEPNALRHYWLLLARLYVDFESSLLFWPS